MVNIILPLGGIGSRFQKDGYYRPKPQIRVLGKEMVLWVLDNLKMEAEDQLIIVYLPKFLGPDFVDIVQSKGHPTARFVELEDFTRGAAETVLFGLKGLSEQERARPTMLVDGDTFYTADIVSKFRAVSRTSGAVFCFKDPQDKPIFSYIKATASGRITEIKEKVKISDYANTGCYCFRDGVELQGYIEKMLEAGETQLSEYYTSGVISMMLREGCAFQSMVLGQDDFTVLGTPEQVVKFCEEYPHQPPRRWCWDLDNTLVTHPVVPGDYTSCLPIPKNIAVVRELHDKGHHIIIHTARRMRTHGGNIPAVVADIGQITIDSLHKYGIPYHEICFGKPYAQFYVDDLAVDPMHDIYKQSGYYPCKIHTKKPGKGGSRELAPAGPSKTLVSAVGGLAAAVGFAAGALLSKK